MAKKAVMLQGTRWWRESTDKTLWCLCFDRDGARMLHLLGSCCMSSPRLKRNRKRRHQWTEPQKQNFGACFCLRVATVEKTNSVARNGNVRLS